MIIRAGLVAIVVLLLGGCAGLDVERHLQNRVYCAVDGSGELAFVSWYYRIGVAAKVSDKANCAALVAAPARPASAP